MSDLGTDHSENHLHHGAGGGGNQLSHAKAYKATK